MALAQQFTVYSEWRNRLSESLVDFRRWLVDNKLDDTQTDLRFERMFEKLHEDRLRIAFVAEFSRGKSELINAIFFAYHGNRMLPSTVGRTTMCPTELMYDPGKEPCIELLPIETRETGTGINDYKRLPAEWTSLRLDIDSQDALQETLRSVSEVRRVSRGTATLLGFPEEGEHTAKADADGLVEIPRWRHAVINYPHPLLQQGLVILDTPGLNAIGAEPELTLSLLPSAHAILFILAADTGVTQSDLDVWNEHIGHSGSRSSGRIVVLNKIDGLWDGLKSDTEIAAEIDRQVHESAQTLGLRIDRIFPVSAQKGLVARVNGNEALLERSRLPVLERALSDELIPAKQDVMRENIDVEFADIYEHARGLLDARLSGLREQLGELAELRGKNRGVVSYMIGKVRVEKEEFETGLQRFHAVRSIFSRQTNRLLELLSVDSLRALALTTRQAMDDASLSRTLSDAMRRFFSEAQRRLREADTEIGEITEMVDALQKKFVIEHGLKLSNPTQFSLSGHCQVADRLEQWCDTHLNTAFHLMTQDKQKLTQRFFSEITNQVRQVFETASRDTESWTKVLIAPIETQIKERQVQLKHRLESIKRILQATGSLDERINELMHSECQLLEDLQNVENAGQTVSLVLNARIEESPLHDPLGETGQEEDDQPSPVAV
ncbi:MAG: dynamin family protein [Candidatus Accumulibacter sp.]|jgi:predicted GTPase|nr:dynamin family protein [Accumulibacter sp.]